MGILFDSNIILNEFDFSLFKKKVEKSINDKKYDISSEDYFKKYHNYNIQKTIQLQPKVMKIIKDNYPELIRKGVFKKSEDFNEYKKMEVENLSCYLGYDHKIRYPLVSWDLWKFTPRARDSEETDEFWKIYKDIESKIKDLIKNDKDYSISDNGDWDGGDICLKFDKTISKPKSISESFIISEDFSFIDFWIDEN